MAYPKGAAVIRAPAILPALVLGLGTFRSTVPPTWRERSWIPRSCLP